MAIKLRGGLKKVHLMRRSAKMNTTLQPEVVDGRATSPVEAVSMISPVKEKTVIDRAAAPVLLTTGETTEVSDLLDAEEADQTETLIEGADEGEVKDVPVSHNSDERNLAEENIHGPTTEAVNEIVEMEGNLSTVTETSIEEEQIADQIADTILEEDESVEADVADSTVSTQCPAAVEEIGERETLSTEENEIVTQEDDKADVLAAQADPTTLKAGEIQPPLSEVPSQAAVEENNKTLEVTIYPIVLAEVPTVTPATEPSFAGLLWLYNFFARGNEGKDKVVAFNPAVVTSKAVVAV